MVSSVRGESSRRRAAPSQKRRPSVKHLLHTQADFAALGLVFYQGGERGFVLGGEFVENGQRGAGVAGLRDLRGFDQAIGDAAHRGDHRDAFAGARTGGNDLRGSRDAGRIADRRSAKFHNLQRRLHGAPIVLRPAGLVVMAECFYFTVAERKSAAMEASKFPIGYMRDLGEGS